MIIETVKVDHDVLVVNNSLSVPINPANRHYQEVLDAIIEHGSDCFEGDIPADLQAAADAKQAAGASVDGY